MIPVPRSESAEQAVRDVQHEEDEDETGVELSVTGHERPEGLADGQSPEGRLEDARWQGFSEERLEPAALTGQREKLHEGLQEHVPQ